VPPGQLAAPPPAAVCMASWFIWVSRVSSVSWRFGSLESLGSLECCGSLVSLGNIACSYCLSCFSPRGRYHPRDPKDTKRPPKRPMNPKRVHMCKCTYFPTPLTFACIHACMRIHPRAYIHPIYSCTFTSTNTYNPTRRHTHT